jgi:hypothetical protein
MLNFAPCHQFVAYHVREVSRVSRWTVALAILVVGCWADGPVTMRAETLGEALSAAFSPSTKPHSPAAKTQKPAAHADDSSVKQHDRTKPPQAQTQPHDSKPVVAHESPTPVPHPREVASPPAVALTATVVDPAAPVAAPRQEPVGPLTPRSVQTLTLLPPAPSLAQSAVPPASVAAAKSGDEAAPDMTAPREAVAPQLAALSEQETGTPAGEPVNPAAPTPPNGLILLQLILLTAICGLVSLNSESRAPLIWLERSRRGGFGDALAKIGQYLRITGRGAPASVTAADAGAQDELARAFTPNWTVVWQTGGAPLAAGAVAVPPAAEAVPSAAQSSAPEPGAEVVQLERACPEFEDQLALLVQDQIVVPLRKAS